MAGEDKMMNVREVAELLHVSEMTIYKVVNKGTLPAFKVGGQWRFKRELLDEWISNESNKERLEKEAREGESTGLD